MTENEIVRIEDKSLDNAISAYKTTIKVFEKSKDSDYCTTLDKVTVALLEELKQYRAIGTIDEFKALKEKETEILLKDGQFLYQQGLVDGYAKAIDEFAEKLKETLNTYIEDAKDEGDYTYIKPFEISKRAVNEVAEQLKAGVKYDNL